MISAPSPWAEIILLAARAVGFGAVFASCVTGLLPFAALSALLLSTVIAVFPAAVGSDAELGQLFTSELNGPAQPLLVPIAVQFATGLILALPLAGALFTTRLFAHWGGALAELRPSVSPPKKQRALESAFLVLCVLSMLPFAGNFYRVFAESFGGVPLQVERANAFVLVSALGKMAFASALYLLLPVMVLFIAALFCLLLFGRLFPALLSEGATRAVLIPLVIFSLALGMYRFSLYCTDGAAHVSSEGLESHGR